MVHTSGLSLGCRRLAVGVAACGVALTAVAAETGVAHAEANGIVGGMLSATPVAGTYQIQQLFPGADGQVWFVTSTSQLGTVSASGQATLTGVVLPHQATTAQIVAAGPEGVLVVQQHRHRAAVWEWLHA